MRKQTILYQIIFFMTILFIINSCDDNILYSERKSKPVDNKPPDTYLFLVVNPNANDQDSLGIDTTASKQIVHWWGEDPDGEVIGYYIQWDYQAEPQWVTTEYDTFYVPIRSAYDEFTFQVWAVDDDSTMDPSPAKQIFPVFNSKPRISFKNRSNPTAPPGNPNVTSYTFPTRTFMWSAVDPDGNETITHIYYALDDTSNWTQLSGNQNSITLTDIPPGEHRFYVKAADIAGAESEIISFPDPQDDMVPNNWVVKEPKGDVLLVNDFAQDQQNKTQLYYENLLKNIIGPDQYSVWEIGSYQFKQENSLPYATIDIKANLDYFDKVVWFSHLGRPNISEAGLSITQYMAEGGHIFITNGNEEQPDTTWTFTRIDSVYRLNPGGRLLTGIEILASFTGTDQDSTLDMEIGQLIGNRVSALIPGAQAKPVYRMQPDTTAIVPIPYNGSPYVGLQ
ncbi:MAG: hypothetical protein GF313_12300, partial [Caldithrix sp.]|nr:hypothetical protein [Caldithrix sp.]